MSNIPNIYIDIASIMRRTMNGRLPAGIDRTLLAYTQHYGNNAFAIVRFLKHYWILPKAESNRLFNWVNAPGSKILAYALIFSGILKHQCRWTKKDNNGILLKIDYYALNKKNYLRMLNHIGVKPIFFVHDLIPMTHPEYFLPDANVHHQILMNQIISRARGIIVNSEETRLQLTQFAERSKLLLPPMLKAWLGSSLKSIIPGKRPIDTTYFLMLSTIEPRKNHLLLLQLWRYIATNYSQPIPKLIIIGQHGWNNQHILNFLERSPSIQGLVITHNQCSDSELVNYLHYARALLFPTFAEGFGLPLIEALSMGVPCIVSSLPVFREIANDIPEYIDPIDGQKWCDTILAYATPNSPSRNAQLERLKKFTPPKWPEHFNQVDNFIQQR